MKLRARIVESFFGDGNFVVADLEEANGGRNHGTRFVFPYIYTLAEAAQLAHEMEIATAVLDKFINDNTDKRPQIDVIV